MAESAERCATIAKQKELPTTTDAYPLTPAETIQKTPSHYSLSGTNVALKTLAEHIAQHLKERGFCVVFDRDLERCWQSNKMAQAEREEKIQDFAQSQGWTAAILEVGFGMRAIFRRLEPGVADSE
jgi:muramoyltetrapeptide carboxypeptidase LdcA involved in peptidoglycan recycling